jgi:hypothetical protein
MRGDEGNGGLTVGLFEIWSLDYSGDGREGSSLCCFSNGYISL